MKKFTLFIALVLTAVFGVKTTASAQTYETEEQIKWINYAVDFSEAEKAADGIYLCYYYQYKENSTTKDKYLFVNAGGEYGTQAIVTNRGMKLTVTGTVQTNGTVSGANFMGTLNNPSEGNGKYLGMEPDNSVRVFLDRSVMQERNWTLTAHTSTNTLSKEYTYYDIKNVGEQYLGIETDKNTLVVSTDKPSGYWLLIPRTAFRKVLLDVTHQTNIEVSGLFQNTRFVRYMDENASWSWYPIEGTSPGEKPLTEDDISRYEGTGLGIASYKAYRSLAPGIEYEVKNITAPGHGEDEQIEKFDYAKSYGSFSAAEMKSPIVMRQQISGIRPGTYTITAQAFVSDDTGDMANKNNRNIGFLFAAGTSGVNQGAEVPILTSGEQGEQTNFTNNFYNYHKKVIKEAAKGDTDQEEVLIQKYFRGNVAAGEYLATGGDYTKSEDAIYNPDTEFKTITLNVTVTDSGNGTGTLTIGAAKYKEQGTLYIANIDITYSGTYEFGINSYSTDNSVLTESKTTGIDEHMYGYARQFNLARDFNIVAGTETTPKWEALVLPVNLTATQVRNAFGDDVKLSKLIGLANNGNQIRFEAVDLASDPNATAILAGECYVIKVTKAPEVARNGSYTFQVYSNDEFTENKPVDVTYPGPIYQIDGVTRTSTLAKLIEANGGTYKDGIVTKTYKNEGKDLNFTGYFYWDAAGVNNAYVVSRGKMFYLETPWKNLTGTMWKLEDPNLNPGEAKDISIDFGDGTITNGISDITADEENTNVTGVYNLNGQKVSDGTTTDNLPKGIYIVNGKKHVVR